MRRDNLPSNARRRPSQPMHFGAQSRSLRAYGLPVNASRPGSPQAHASLGSGWRPTLAGWAVGLAASKQRLPGCPGDEGHGGPWIPTGFRTRFQRSHHGILSPLTGLSRHTRWCMNDPPELARNDPHPEAPHLPISYDSGPPRSVIRFRMLHASSASALCPPGVRARRPVPMIDLYLKKAFSTRACRW